MTVRFFTIANFHWTSAGILLVSMSNPYKKCYSHSV